MTETTVLQLQHRVAYHQDEAAYQQLFTLFYAQLLRQARRQLSAADGAEDLVADVMLKLWTMGEKLAGVDNLSRYLYTAIRNQAINLLTKKTPLRQYQPVADAEYIPCTAYSPEEKVLKLEERHFLQKAIANLPERCQAVYRLIREDGMSYKEVAGILGISENTVDRHLNNALHKLVASLGAYYNERKPIVKKTGKAVGSWKQMPVLPILPTIASPVWKGSYT